MDTVAVFINGSNFYLSRLLIHTEIEPFAAKRT